MYKIFKRTHRPGTFEVQMAGACDPGIARDHNEDAISLQEDDGRGYYLGIVCDGMGGHNAGEIASAIAVEEISSYIYQHFNTKDPTLLLEEAFTAASERIDEHAEVNPEAKGMGCTCVLAMGVGDTIYLAHSGDSRAYGVNGAQIGQLTTDHTMVQEMVDSGLITNEQAAVHPYRGRISRCLGHGKNKSDPTVNACGFDPGENLLLCSDGLSDVLADEEIAALVNQQDVKSSARRLIEAANRAGGPDNISVIVMRRLT